jgi:hypothetical protein
MSKRSSLVSLVPAVIAGAWIAHAVAASPEDERRLDTAGSNICRESSALERAVAGARQMRREVAKAAQQMSRNDEAEQRRAFLQDEFNQRALGAQEQIVADTRRTLISYQAEYRQVAGRDFDPALCEGGRLRVTYDMRLHEQQEREWESTKDMMKKALADGEQYRLGQIACEDWKILQLPAEQVERWRPGYRAEAQSRFAAFSSDYRRRTGKSFDTVSCR